MRRVVIAPDSFKGTVSAASAASAIARGWLRNRPNDEILVRPMADGGEGTLDAFAMAISEAVPIPLTVRGPAHGAATVEAFWLLLPDGTGVVELASTAGLALVDPLAPLDAHTAGFGEAIVQALDAGVERLLLGLGGSASTDGGAGALSALGARFFDATGNPVPQGNRGLSRISSVDLTGMRSLPSRGALILGDVTNPLLGQRGAAIVFGPQKGADSTTTKMLEANLGRFANAVPRGSEIAAVPGAGAAGGTGFGLMMWGARMGAGARVVADVVGLAETIAQADLVITGEGRFDGQSKFGKAPTEVAEVARRAGVPVALVAGGIAADPDDFVAAISLADLAGSSQAAVTDPVSWLEAAGSQLVQSLLW